MDPECLLLQIVDYPGYTHVAFVAATNAGDLVYSEVLRYMEELS